MHEHGAEDGARNGAQGGALNPAQREVLHLLGAPREERPRFDPSLGRELVEELEQSMSDLTAELDPSDPLFLSKRILSDVHGCEARYLATRDRPFEWNPAIARGSVAHKAIELTVHWRGRADPLDMVDEAMARLANDGDGLGEWLATCSPADRAEVRALANERVVTFLECFPPLKARWTPVTECRLRANLADGRVILSGRTDLSLGRPEGDLAGKVIIDLKTGSMSPRHLDDLRFYALIETIRIGVPPRIVASYYLDAARIQSEVVTEGVLRAAVRRTADGARVLRDLAHGTREPVYRSSPACRWCPALSDCTVGTTFLAGDDADGVDID